MTSRVQTIRFALDYARFAQACDLPRRAPQDIEMSLSCILFNAKGLTNWAIKSCNGIPRRDPKTNTMLPTWTDADEKAKEEADAAAVAAIRKSALHLFGDVEFSIEFQGDPRGCPVKFIIQSREWAIDAG